MSARDEIAAAATLPGVTKVTPYHRQSLKPGDGFVRLAGRVRGSRGFGWVNTWQVWLALPQNVAEGERWLDEHLGDLVDAVDAEIIVTSADPAELVLPNATVNGLIVAGTREG